MTFLALSPTQVAALAAGTTAAVLLLFFLKLRRPPVLVSSVLLWDRLLGRDAPRAWRERLRRLLSLLLALGIALAVAIALGRPASSSAKGGVAVLIDTSTTMTARMRQGATRLDEAKRMARGILESHSASPRFLVGDTSGAPPVQASTVADALAAVDAVAEAPYAGLPTLADDVTTFVLTDGVAQAAPAGPATTIPVFEPVPNVTLEAFAVDAGEADDPVTARFTIANQGTAATALMLEVTAPQGAVRTPRLTLEAGHRRGGSVDLVDIGEGPVTASVLAERDGFAADNTAADLIPRRRRVLVALVARGRGPLHTALTAEPRFELIELPADASDAGALRGADVAVYDGIAPAVPPPVPALVLGPARSGVTVAGRVRLGPMLDSPAIAAATSSHPILRGVTWTDVRVHRAAKVDTADGEVTLPLMLTADGASLLSAIERPRLVVAGFGVTDTDLPLQPSFPIVVRNAVRWLAGDATIVRAATGPVVLPAGSARVHSANGTPVATRSRLGTTVFDAPRPGVYFAEVDGERQAIVVNRPGGSAGPNASALVAAPAGPSPRSGAGTEWWPVLLLAAVALAALEWWTYHRRITV